MKKPVGVLLKALVILAALSLYACFSITVNVYFPAKDVKSAFKSLEDQLMKGEQAPGGEPGEPGEPAPGGDNQPAPGPQSWLFELIGPDAAYADTAELSSELADKLREDPDVKKAYSEMGGRLGYIDKLRDSGVVGEASNGMLSARQELGKKDALALEKENDNRSTIIWAMARAIVEINGQPVNNDTIKQVLDKAASEFSAVRRDAAKRGWWVQKPDGSWSQK